MGQSMRVLIIEDVETVRENLTYHLKQHFQAIQHFRDRNLNLIGASTLAEVFRILEFQRPELVISDVLLGALNARDTLGELLTQRKIPVLWISATPRLSTELRKPCFDGSRVDNSSVQCLLDEVQSRLLLIKNALLTQ